MESELASAHKREKYGEGNGGASIRKHSRQRERERRLQRSLALTYSLIDQQTYYIAYYNQTHTHQIPKKKYEKNQIQNIQNEIHVNGWKKSIEITN